MTDQDAKTNGASIDEAQAAREAALAEAQAAYEAAIAKADAAYKEATGKDAAPVAAPAAQPASEEPDLGAAFMPEGFGDGQRPKNMRPTPTGFTKSLAFFDLVPVAIFAVATLLLARYLDSRLFLIGALLCIAAGALKALWKIAITMVGVDEWRLNRQFIIVMPFGFVAMIAALFIDLTGPVTLDAFLAQATSAPAVIFLVLWVVGMVAMGVLGSRLDLNEPRSNWIEEFLNTAAQVCLLIFALLVV